MYKNRVDSEQMDSSAGVFLKIKSFEVNFYKSIHTD